MWCLVYSIKNKDIMVPLAERQSEVLKFPMGEFLELAKGHPYFKVQNFPDANFFSEGPSSSFSMLKWQDYIAINYFSGEYIDLGEYSSEDLNPLVCLTLIGKTDLPDSHLVGRWAWQSIAFLKKGSPECQQALTPTATQRVVNLGVPFARF